MKKIYIILIACLFTVGCTEAKYVAHVAKQIPIPNDQQSVGHFKVGNPYTIKGRRYYPKESYNYAETGIASWYGPQFHGKQTANGEIFDKYELTAAHRTLQLPSIIRVTNVTNGRSVILRVNDRGPFAHDRVLDVSERAAELLGFKNDGTTTVRINILPQESKQVAALSKAGNDTRGFEVALNSKRNINPDENMILPPRQPIQRVELASVNTVDQGNDSAIPLTQVPRIYVQAGAFSEEQNALSLSNRLSTYGPSKVYLTRINNQPYFRVRLGPYQDEKQAQNIASALLQSGNPNTKVIID